MRIAFGSPFNIAPSHTRGVVTLKGQTCHKNVLVQWRKTTTRQDSSFHRFSFFRRKSRSSDFWELHYLASWFKQSSILCNAKLQNGQKMGVISSKLPKRRRAKTGNWQKKSWPSLTAPLALLRLVTAFIIVMITKSDWSLAKNSYYDWLRDWARSVCLRN